MKDIHNFSLKLETELKKLDNCKISKNNKKIIREFYRDNSLQGLSKARLVRLVCTARYMAEWLKIDFDEVTIEDIKNLVQWIDAKEEWTVWTKATYKAILKKFFKWLKKVEDGFLHRGWRI